MSNFTDMYYEQFLINCITKYFIFITWKLLLLLHGNSYQFE